MFPTLQVSRILTVGAIALCAAVVSPLSPAIGQSSSARGASAYVPLDDNAYVYADALIARGRLSSLSQLERPYRVSDIQRAIAADTMESSPSMRKLYEALAWAIVKYDVATVEPEKEDALRFAVTPYLLTTAQSSGIRDLMRADSTTRVRPGFGGVGVVQGGPIIAAARAYLDPRLKDDPEFLGQKNHWYTGRMEDAYISGQFKYGEVFVGRLGRNWGPPQLDGLLLGHYAYTYDHVYIKLGVPALHLSSVITRLDDQTRTNGLIIDSANRYFSVHQLALRYKNFEAAVSEAVVYGGPNENFRLNYSNPVTPYILTQVLEKAKGNILFGLDLAYRSRYGNFSAQGMLDDVAKDNCGPSCEKPNSFAFTFGAEGVPFWRDYRLFAFYTLVNNLAYRNTHWESHYTSQNVSLGRGYSDYDEFRLGVDVISILGIPLRAYVAHRRQGEGDYRQPHPTVPEYPVTEQFLQGTVQSTTRFALSATGGIMHYLQFSTDLGYNRVTNAQHLPNRKKSTFEGRLKVTLESPWRFAAALLGEE